MAKSNALTDTKIKNLKTPGKYTDGRGLYLLVTETGSKLWHYRYMFAGKERLMALGSYPSITLAAAREKHLEERRRVTSGVDPMAVKKAEKVAKLIAYDHSFANVAEKWHKHWKEGKSPRHADDTWRRMQANVIPVLGTLPISEITMPQIVAMIKDIASKDDRIEMARRCAEMTGQVFRWAAANGVTPHERNPMASVKLSEILKARKAVNFARVDATELPELLRAIVNYKGSPITRHALTLLSLTFVRTSELIESRWSEFTLDGDAPVWKIPAERMKMDTLHIVPLSTQAVETLRLIHALTGKGEYLFPGDRGNATMSNNTILKALERMGYKGRMTGHGFRGLASTVLNETLRADRAHVELQLAHLHGNAVERAYNHAQHLDARRKMMQDWADFLEKTQRANVLQMKRSA